MCSSDPISSPPYLTDSCFVGLSSFGEDYPSYVEGRLGEEATDVITPLCEEVGSSTNDPRVKTWCCILRPRTVISTHCLGAAYLGCTQY
jgi:hypothetical protein